MVASGENAQGVSLFQRGQYDSAGRRFMQAIEAQPHNADGYYNLAATHHQLWKTRGNPQDAEQAERLYNQGLNINPEHRECYRGLAVLLVEKGDANAAVRLLTNWSGTSAAPAEAKIELARLYEEFGDTNQARVRLTEALQLDPRNGRALSALARLQETGGDSRQALVNYMRAYESDPALPGLAQRIAALQTSMGNAPTVAAGAAPRTASAPDLSRTRY